MKEKRLLWRIIISDLCEEESAAWKKGSSLSEEGRGAWKIGSN